MRAAGNERFNNNSTRHDNGAGAKRVPGLSNAVVGKKPALRPGFGTGPAAGVAVDRAPPSHVRRVARFDVEIWSKAAIGDYFWTDIFQGTTEIRANGHSFYGEQEVGDIRFK